MEYVPAKVQLGTTSRKKFPVAGRVEMVNGLYRWKAPKGTMTFSRIGNPIAYAGHRLQGPKLKNKDEFGVRFCHCARPLMAKAGEDGEIGYDFVPETRCPWCEKNPEDWERVRRASVNVAALMMVLGTKPFAGGGVSRTNELMVFTYNPKERQKGLDEAIGEATQPATVCLRFELEDTEDAFEFQKYAIYRAGKDEALNPTAGLLKEYKDHIARKSIEKLATPPSYEDAAKALEVYYRPSGLQGELGADAGVSPSGSLSVGTVGGEEIPVESETPAAGEPAPASGDVEVGDQALEAMLEEKGL